MVGQLHPSQADMAPAARRPLGQDFMRTADAWLAYGTRQARDVVELGADPARTVFAPITALAPERSADRARRYAPAGDTRYLFVGRLIERKGPRVLLQAFRRFDGGELWIAGDGPLARPSPGGAGGTRASASSGTSAAMISADALHRRDALVVPSLYEAWGLVVHEGLA